MTLKKPLTTSTRCRPILSRASSPQRSTRMTTRPLSLWPWRLAGYFELDAAKAREIAAQVGRAVSKWRDVSARHGLTKPEIDRMPSAFEHKDLEMARARR